MTTKKYNTALEQQRAWREANKERVKATAKAWWQNNKGRYPKPRKPERPRKVIKMEPITKAELSKEDIYYIENHIQASVDFETIANRACCEVSDVERVERRMKRANIQNIG